MANTKTVFKGNAKFYIKKEFVSAFKNEVHKIIAPTLQEKGCVSYEAYQVLDEQGNLTNAFEFHELWTTKEAMLVDHKDNTPHMIHFFNTIRIGEADSWVDKVEISGHYVEILNK